MGTDWSGAQGEVTGKPLNADFACRCGRVALRNRSHAVYEGVNHTLDNCYIPVELKLRQEPLNPPKEVAMTYDQWFHRMVRIVEEYGNAEHAHDDDGANRAKEAIYAHCRRRIA